MTNFDLILRERIYQTKAILKLVREWHHSDDMELGFPNRYWRSDYVPVVRYADSEQNVRYYDDFVEFWNSPQRRVKHFAYMALELLRDWHQERRIPIKDLAVHIDGLDHYTVTFQYSDPKHRTVLEDMISELSLVSFRIDGRLAQVLNSIY